MEVNVFIDAKFFFSFFFFCLLLRVKDLHFLCSLYIIILMIIMDSFLLLSPLISCLLFFCPYQLSRLANSWKGIHTYIFLFVWIISIVSSFSLS